MRHIIGRRRRTGAERYLVIALAFGPLAANPWRHGIGATVLGGGGLVSRGKGVSPLIEMRFYLAGTRVRPKSHARVHPGSLP